MPAAAAGLDGDAGDLGRDVRPDRSRESLPAFLPREDALAALALQSASKFRRRRRPWDRTELDFCMAGRTKARAELRRDMVQNSFSVAQMGASVKATAMYYVVVGTVMPVL